MLDTADKGEGRENLTLKFLMEGVARSGKGQKFVAMGDEGLRPAVRHNGVGN